MNRATRSQPHSPSRNRRDDLVAPARSGRRAHHATPIASLGLALAFACTSGSGPSTGADGGTDNVVDDDVSECADDGTLGSGGELLWQLPHHLIVESPPAVAEDGTILVHGKRELQAPSDTPTLLSVSPSGQLNWAVDTSASDAPVPVSIAGDQIVAPTRHLVDSEPIDALLRYDFDGNALSALPLDGRQGGAAAVSDDGTVYVPSASVFAFAGDSTAWSAPTLGLTGSNTAIGPGGDIYVAGRAGDTYLRSLSPTGEEVWKVNLGSPVIRPLALDAEGRIYVLVNRRPNDFEVYAELTVYDADGRPQWSFVPRSSIDDNVALAEPSGAIVDENGMVYFTVLDTRFLKTYLIAVRDEGGKATEQWRVQFDALFNGTPALSGAGTVYVADICRTLYAIDRSSGSELWRYEAPIVQNDCAGGITGLAIGVDGTVFATLNGRVHGTDGDPMLIAVSGDGSGPSCSAPWPAEQRGRGHTGSL